MCVELLGSCGKKAPGNTVENTVLYDTDGSPLLMPHYGSLHIESVLLMTTVYRMQIPKYKHLNE